VVIRTPSARSTATALIDNPTKAFGRKKACPYKKGGLYKLLAARLS
jgi:hypothetical protein